MVLFTKWSQGQTQHSPLPWTVCPGPLDVCNPNPLTRALPTCLQRTHLLVHSSHGQCITCTFSKKKAVVLKRRQCRQSSLPRLGSFSAAALQPFSSCHWSSALAQHVLMKQLRGRTGVIMNPAGQNPCCPEAYLLTWETGKRRIRA